MDDLPKTQSAPSKKAKPKRGRPPSAEGPMPASLRVRFRRQEMDEVAIAAEQEKRTVSEVARELLLRWARRKLLQKS